MRQRIAWSWKGYCEPDLPVGILTLHLPDGAHEVPMLSFAAARTLVDNIERCINHAVDLEIDRLAHQVNTLILEGRYR